jgi:hypothetical protein
LEKLGREIDTKVSPDKGIMVPFMHYLIRDFIGEIKERLPDLMPIQVAYVCKGIINMKKLLN